VAEFNIVHLSDLHIKGDYLSLTLTNLINDVAERTKGMKNIILVISGDIVDKGQYRGKTGELNPVALNFFSQLNDALTDKPQYVDPKDKQVKVWDSKRVIDVQIVAGNHDKDILSDFAKNISEQFQQDENFIGDKEEWLLEKRYYEDFIAFVNEVYRMFDLRKEIERQTCSQYKEIQKSAIKAKSPCAPANPECCTECNEVDRIENEIDNNTQHLDPNSYFCKLSIERKKIDDTFGVEFVEVPCLGVQVDKENHMPDEERSNNYCKRCKPNECTRQPDVTLCFIRINTTFISNGKRENHLMSIGEYQLESIKDEYQKGYMERMARDEHVITICLAHHPMTFLKPHEEDKLREYLLDSECLNADFYLCGHTHERQVSSLSRKGREVKTLVTGIGWPHGVEYKNDELESAHKDTHSYSIYTFNEEKNILSTRMLRTNIHGIFEDDFSYYNTKAEKRLKKISVPLKLEDHSFIEFNGQENSINELFVDRTTLNQIREMYKSKDKFINGVENELKRIVLKLCRDHMSGEWEGESDIEIPDNETTNRHRDETIEKMTKALETFSLKETNIETYDNFLFSPQIDNAFSEIIDSRIKAETDFQYKTFEAFLCSLAMIFIRSFKGSFSNDDVRLVIRIYNDKKDARGQYVVYTPFFEWPIRGRKSTTEYKWSNGTENYITAEAFHNQQPMIYTLNKDLVDFKVTNWEDFIVMVPTSLKFKPNNNAALLEEYPALSFVFSVNLNEELIKENNFLDTKKIFKELSNKLYLLEFIEIHDAISMAINKFSKIYEINVKEFVDYKKKTNENLNENQPPGDV